MSSHSLSSTPTTTTTSTSPFSTGRIHRRLRSNIRVVTTTNASLASLLTPHGKKLFLGGDDKNHYHHHRKEMDISSTYPKPQFLSHSAPTSTVTTPNRKTKRKRIAKTVQLNTRMILTSSTNNNNTDNNPPRNVSIAPRDVVLIVANEKVNAPTDDKESSCDIRECIAVLSPNGTILTTTTTTATSPATETKAVTSPTTETKAVLTASPFKTPSECSKVMDKNPALSSSPIVLVPSPDATNKKFCFIC